MGWEVEYTDEFGRWWDTLTEEEQGKIDASVMLLEKYGPTLETLAKEKALEKEIGDG